MPKIKLFVSIGLVGCQHEDVIEIDDAEWGKMTLDERDERLTEEAREYAYNFIEYGAYLAESENT